MREIDPVGALWKHVDKHPNRTEAARALGIKPAYLSDLLTGRRGFSDNVLFALGLRKAIVPADGAARFFRGLRKAIVKGAA